MYVAGPQANATFFRSPPSAKASFILALVVQTGLAGFAICAFGFVIRPPDTLMLMTAVAFFGWLGIVTVRRLRSVSDRVAVDDGAIWYLPNRGETTCIHWSELSRVQHHKIMYYMSIADKAGIHRIKVEYGIENLDKLKESIRYRAINRRAVERF